MLQLLGDPLPGLRPWTPLGDFRPPDPLPWTPQPQISRAAPERHMRRYVAPVWSSRFHNFYASQLYMSLRDHMLSRRLCRVVKRPLQYLHWYNCLLERGYLVTSHVYFNQSISEVTFDLAWLWKVRGRFTLVRSTLYLHQSSSCSSILRYGLQHVSTKSIP